MENTKKSKGVLMTLTQITKKIKVSPSAIKTYEDCHRKYYYTYIEKPKIKKQDSPHLHIGNMVHKVMELFHQRFDKNDPSSWQKLITSITKEVEPSYFPKLLSEEHRPKCRELIKKYYDYIIVAGFPNLVKDNEEHFKFGLTWDGKYVKSKDINESFEGVIVSGIKDRVDINNEGVPYVVDYKTGKSAYLSDFQLAVYAIDEVVKDPSLKKIGASYLVLGEMIDYDKKTNAPIVKAKGVKSYVFEEKEIAEAVKKILSIGDEILSDKTWNPMKNKFCGFCDFKEICPAMMSNKSDKNTFYLE